MNASTISDPDVTTGVALLAEARKIDLSWNSGLIVGAFTISLLGAFTASQLICQARTATHFSDVLVWTALASITFSFCGIWAMHEVAMLACKIDLPVQINPLMTTLGLFLAASFTFLALASDTVWTKFTEWRRKKQEKIERHKRREARNRAIERTISRPRDEESMHGLLSHAAEDDFEPADLEAGASARQLPRSLSAPDLGETDSMPRPSSSGAGPLSSGPLAGPNSSSRNYKPSLKRSAAMEDARPATSRGYHALRPSAGANEPHDDDHDDPVFFSNSNRSRSGSSSAGRSSSSLFGSNNIAGFPPLSCSYSATVNLFIRTALVLYHGSTLPNIVKSFIWSLAVTGMHYVDILGLKIPEGHFTIDVPLLLVSELISWIVCLVGCILMSEMEAHLGQQIVFSVVATGGVAAMHFTGMYAVNWWSTAPPSDHSGYPPALAASIGSIAIAVCLVANAILAHVATVARNRLAEIVMTRKKLWMAIAQKQNAESAAAARSEFIASASHEIRTPLHHLQGYTDLLSRTELTEEGQVLLMAIQRATKTLSLITNNVLDWSKLERNGEAISRPVALDVRVVCESLITMLPNEDEDVAVELLVVIAPNVPHALFLDETYIHRVIMNLLSNAMKFTYSGYVLLLGEIKDDQLVLTVKDTGVGIPESFLPQLFEPFKQANTRGISRGTGLGLSIVKQLLHRMDGAIDVESVHGETMDVKPEDCGSTFTVTIPVKRLHSPRDDPEPPSTEAGGIIESKGQVAVFKGTNSLASEAVCLAWKTFNYEPFIATSYSDIESGEHENLKYIWVELETLRSDPELTKDILSQEDYQVLVPYDIHKELHGFPKSISSRRVIPIRKPLIWHTIRSVIEKATQDGLFQRVRFADIDDVVEDDKDVENSKAKEQKTSVEVTELSKPATLVPKTSQGPVILLVEDNPVCSPNQSLENMITGYCLCHISTYTG